MTREEAIRQIRDNIDFRKRLQEGDKPQFFDADENEKDIEAFEMAIQSLSAIEDIKVEIDQLPSYVARFNGGDFAIHIDKEGVVQIINKHICGKESE